MHAPPPLWPPITAAMRPWTRWWWLGSAVDEAEITRHLALFEAAGFGGVEISPIYGATGVEGQYVPFLSPRWIDLLGHTIREAWRLGLGVDMISGTGWPLGGPWVRPADAAKHVLFETYRLSEGERLAAPITSQTDSQASLQVVMAYADGQALDLTAQVDSLGRLDWTAPAGEWRLVALFQAGTGQQVKRAAPGGEGNVVDHYSAAAIARYLGHFDAPLAALAAEDRLRSFFNDSFEVYGANWSTDLLTEFEARRGYDLRAYLLALIGQAAPDLVSRVRSDYRQTIHDMLLENFVQPWTAWAHRHGSLSRNQAHGSPGNLLDLYAAADIPETETFGGHWLRLAGRTVLPGTIPRPGDRPEIIACKLASSAAHVAGKPLTSSESFTWLGEHGLTPLDHMKAEVDLALVMGINHLFFHGTPFSPATAEWPGWLFYASTHVAPTNTFWRDLPALNEYITRCQSFLQAGQPANDLLLYLPIYDLWAGLDGATDLLYPLTPHNTANLLEDHMADFTTAARWLCDQGYSYDLVSDALLTDAVHVDVGQLRSGGGEHRAILVAGCTHMPPATLARILALAEDGATVLVVGDLPHEVPGLTDLTQRRQQLHSLVAALGLPHPLPSAVVEVSVGQGRLLVGSDLAALLEQVGIPRESVVDHDIEVIRRREAEGYRYFMVHFGNQPLDQWVSLPLQAASVAIIDPLSGRQGLAATRPGLAGTTEVHLQLAPGEACLLRTSTEVLDLPAWVYLTPAGEPIPIRGEWQVEFIEGGPTLPAPTVVDRLTSWTEWPGDTDALRAFAGTARYTITVETPAIEADAWALDLGEVGYSARVRLDGQDLGTLFSRPFRVSLPQPLSPGTHRLEIEVTNLMANRLADLDRWGVTWRTFFLVNTAYEPFDASGWDPLPSGLLSDVQLIPLKRPSALNG